MFTIELIKSDTLANGIIQEPERLDEYPEKFVELTRKLQTVSFDDGTLIKANDAFRERFTTELKDVLTAEEMSELIRLIDSMPKRNTLIHSDLHTRNVMIQDDELLLIDMDELMCGHPIYDICPYFCLYFGCGFYLWKFAIHVDCAIFIKYDCSVYLSRYAFLLYANCQKLMFKGKDML